MFSCNGNYDSIVISLKAMDISYDIPYHVRSMVQGKAPLKDIAKMSTGVAWAMAATIDANMSSIKNTENSMKAITGLDESIDEASLAILEIERLLAISKNMIITMKESRKKRVQHVRRFMEYIDAPNKPAPNKPASIEIPNENWESLIWNKKVVPASKTGY